MGTSPVPLSEEEIPVSDQVSAECQCPTCGESEVDFLLINDYGTEVYCINCDACYMLEEE